MSAYEPTAKEVLAIRFIVEGYKEYVDDESLAMEKIALVEKYLERVE
jgi:hypothetical protein